MKQKLEISNYLKDLNKSVDRVNKFRYDEINVNKLDCKKLADRLGVTAATITNATLDSKFSLVLNIAEEIYDCYFGYFVCQEDVLHEVIDVWWVLRELTHNL